MAGRMQVRGRWLAQALAALGGIGMTLGVVGGNRAASGADRVGRPEPWVELESMLKREGVKTDLASLRGAARSGPDLGVRWMAVEVLGLRGDQASRPILKQVVQSDPERLVRETAALALARLGDQEGLAALKELMETAEPHRRTYLAARLAELNEPAGYRFVAEATAGENAQLKLLSIASLVPFVPFQGRQVGILIDPVDRLLALAKDADPRIRREALINIPTAVVKGAPLATYRPVVETMARSDPDPDIREMARLDLIQWDEEARRKAGKP